MKLFKKLLSLFIVVSLMSGCMPHTELDQLAITEAIGIDYADGKYEVTVQYFNMEGAGGNSPIDPSKSNVINVTGKGDTVSAALESASIKCGRGFMYGITTIIILGREALGQDVRKTLSFAESYYQSDPSVLIAAADGKASDILGVKFKEGIISVEKLEMIITNAEYYGLAESVKILEFLSEQHRKNAATALPLLKEAETGSDATDDGKSVELTGGVLISEHKLSSDLSLSDLAGLQLLGKKPQNTVVGAKVDGANVSVTIYDIDTNITHELTEEGLKFYIKIHANGKYTDSQLNSKSDYYGETVEDICAETLKKRTEEALLNTVFKHGCDPCELKYVITSSDYMEWIRIEDNFGEILKNAEFFIECDIDIDRFGIAH